MTGLALVLVSCAACTHVSRFAATNEGGEAPTSRIHRFTVPKEADNDELAEAMSELARQLLESDADAESQSDLLSRMQLELVAEDMRAAQATLHKLGAQVSVRTSDAAPAVVVYRIYADALHRNSGGVGEYGEAYTRAFTEAFSGLDDREASEVAWYLGTSGFVFEQRLESALAKVSGTKTMERDDAVRLARAWLAQKVHADTAPYVPDLLAAEQERRYIIDDDVLIRTPEGATLSATIVRPRAAKEPLPTALAFTIYANETADRRRALTAASHGYVGMVAYTRGKYLSEDEIQPYEHEVDDTYAVIDWISRQPWSNGDVGMYGGSYDGFAAWAATKRLHPALKSIVPYVAAIPGQGLPMTNNVFLSANYGWAFYVTNNRTLDQEIYGDRERWSELPGKWYASGRPYREIDQVDGTPNPWLQRWLDHPAYDAYWQAMVPYGRDYADIDIPVLSITGYYDDGQISALQYLREHYRYRPDAEHYLVIGPYDHFGAQHRKAAELRGYHIDPVAQFNTQALTFEWLDHVLRGGERPALLQDRINYQVMGANRWRHAPSLKATAGETLRLYLAGEPEGDFHRLSTEVPDAPAALTQVVDLADRSTVHNSYYPDPIRGGEANFSTGLTFVSEPFEAPVEVNGMFSGGLKITINKRDADLGAVLYELLPDGTLFHLSYYLGRASYAEDSTERHLLEPGVMTEIRFDRTVMVSRRLEAGSRLMVVVDVNKNPWHQINYGTGKDVSDESIADADEPLRVQWHNASYVDVPILREE